MAGSPRLFIDGKFIGCPRPHSKNARFHKGLEAFTRQTIASQGAILRDFQRQNQLITVQNRPE